MNVADDVPNAHGEKTRTKKNARCWFTVGHIAHEPPGNVANDKPKPTGGRCHLGGEGSVAGVLPVVDEEQRGEVAVPVPESCRVETLRAPRRQVRRVDHCLGRALHLGGGSPQHRQAPCVALECGDGRKVGGGEVAVIGGEDPVELCFLVVVQSKVALTCKRR